MKSVRRHVARCCIAGIVALMPLVGAVLSVVVLERTLSESFLQKTPIYFPGLGILIAVVAVYVIGLVVSTLVGRWAFGLFDRMLANLPGIGMLYKTLKQILGYGDGEDGMFREVVLVRAKETDAEEIGLVTGELVADDGAVRWTVFVPGSPNPGAGRLLLVEPGSVTRLDTPVSEALKALVAVGKHPIDVSRVRA